MRKLDYLRKVAKKIKSEEDVYHIDVDSFRLRGEVGFPVAVPLGDMSGNLIGVSVQHSYSDGDGGTQTVYEYYHVPFPKVKDCD